MKRDGKTYCWFESDENDQKTISQHEYKTPYKCREHELKNVVTFLCYCGRQFTTKELLRKHWASIAIALKVR
jgi:hypothetical protein